MPNSERTLLSAAVKALAAFPEMEGPDRVAMMAVMVTMAYARPGTPPRQLIDCALEVPGHIAYLLTGGNYEDVDSPFHDLLLSPTAEFRRRVEACFELYATLS
jgi:hypothetical protein